MGSTVVSLLEERLQACLQQWTTSHPDGYHLAGGGPVLDLGCDDDDGERAADPAAAAPDEVPSEPVGEVGPGLAPEACLVGVRDQVALEWAARTPGVGLLAAVEELWADLSADLVAACRSTDIAVPDADGDSGAADSPVDSPVDSPADTAAADSTCAGISDAELVEAVAACERQIAALSARRDQLAGVFATRRHAEAEADLAAARAASAADGRGRPWATRIRSTAASELCARLGIGSSASEALVERGMAALGAHRDVAAAMAAGALPAAAGAWMLEQVTAVRTTAYLSALERESAAREQAVADRRSAEDAARAQAGEAPLTREELRARAAADQADVDAEAEAAAAAHAEAVAAAVRRELLGKATGTAAWSAEGAGQDLAPVGAGTDGTDGTDGTGGADGIGSGDGGCGAGGTGREGSSPTSSTSQPTSRPTAGAGLGPNRRAWTKRLNTAVHRADGAAAQRRAERARKACSTSRWSEPDGQAALQLRGPAEDIAVITAAMDARARRRQDTARAAERAAAQQEGRAFDRAAVGSLDAHRIAALKEWASAALEISQTSGVSGTWYPIARTAASRPVVHLVLPWTVLAGVSTIGAQLAGYGPIGALAAVRIASDGMWRRVLADPACGAAVGVEERAWRPSAALSRLVGLRWWSSTMPSSTRPVGLDHGPAGGASGAGSAGGGQLDHVQPYPRPEQHAGAEAGAGGGATEATNLQLLAQVEHLLKQAGEHAPTGHGWSVAVDRTGSPRPDGPDGADPGPAPGDGVVWTSPTGHTYRVHPEPLLDPDDAPDNASVPSLDCIDGSSGGGGGGGLPAWVHRLLADVLPAWVGWPPDGRPATTGHATTSPAIDDIGGDEAAWSTDWAHAVLTDLPPDPAPDDVDDGEEPCLFDDLPAA